LHHSGILDNYLTKKEKAIGNTTVEITNCIIVRKKKEKKGAKKTLINNQFKRDKLIKIALRH